MFILIPIVLTVLIVCVIAATRLDDSHRRRRRQEEVLDERKRWLQAQPRDHEFREQGFAVGGDYDIDPYFQDFHRQTGTSPVVLNERYLQALQQLGICLCDPPPEPQDEACPLHGEDGMLECPEPDCSQLDPCPWGGHQYQ